MAVPTIRAVGAVAANAAAIAPGLPAGTAAGDLLIMALETAEVEAITVSGWTQAPSSPVTVTSGAGGTRLTIFYKIAAGGDATTTSDSGNHQLGRIVGITAGTFNASNPFNTSSTNTQTSTTSVSITGATTTVADCLILAFSAGELPDAVGTAEFSSPANASLTSVTEQIDNTTNAGNGGALLCISGAKAAAGTYGATTATAATAAVRANISLAIAPPVQALDGIGTAANAASGSIILELAFAGAGTAAAAASAALSLALPLAGTGSAASDGAGTLDVAAGGVALSNTFEAGSDETAISEANSGGASGDPFDDVFVSGSGAVVYDDDDGVAEGTMAMRASVPTAPGVAYVSWESASLAAQTEAWYRFYYRTSDATPTTNHDIFRLNNAGANAMNAQLRSGGVIGLRDQSSTLRFSSTTVLADNTLYRIEVHVVHSATVGHMEARIFHGANLHGTTPDEQFGDLTTNYNTLAASDERRIGIVSTPGQTINEWFDGLAVSLTGWVGPAAGTGGAVALDGQGTTASSGTAAVAVALTLTGQGTAANGGTAALAVAIPLTGQGTSAAAATASLGLLVPLTGTGTAASSGNAILDRLIAITGAGTAASSGTGSANVALTLTGTGTAASTGTATAPNVARSLTGTGTAASSATAAIRLALPLAGQGTTAAAGNASIRLALTLNGSGTAAAGTRADLTLQGQQALAGAGMSASSGTANVSLSLTVTGSGAAATSATGQLLRTFAVTGQGAAAAAANGLVNVAIPLSGTAAASADSTANLIVDITLAGQGEAAATASSELTFIPKFFWRRQPVAATRTPVDFERVPVAFTRVKPEDLPPW